MPRHNEKMQKKEVIFFKANNILLTKWMDKREVNMLSTIHRPLVFKAHNIDWSEDKKHNLWKPESVVHCNTKMRLVDQSDAMISSIDSGRLTLPLA